MIRVEVTHDDLEQRSTVTIIIAGWQFFRYFHNDPLLHSTLREKRAERCAIDVAAKHALAEIDVYETNRGWRKLPVQ